MMRIAFLGCGNVGAPLADQLQRLGYDVMLGSRESGGAGVRQALTRNPLLTVESVEVAVGTADIVFLATPFAALRSLIPPLADKLAGKVLVDCTNPVGPGLRHALNSVQSGSEFLQELAPLATVVKAFSIYGFENLDDHSFPTVNTPPVMMFCGGDPAAKSHIGAMIRELGWVPLDVGGLDQALHLEHMTLLWVRMVRVHGHSPHLTWAMLTRSDA